MKNKNKKRLLASLCFSLMLAALPLGFTACGDPNSESTPDSSVVEEVFDGGDWYADVSGEEYGLTLADGAATLKMGDTLTGTYTYASGTATLHLANGTTATAKVEDDGTVVLTYEGATYTFLEKIEYTVSFSVEGTVASTETVWNGRKATKPEDPRKENYLFVGWYSDSAFKNSYAFDASPVVGNITLYARFIEKSATEYESNVTLMVDGEALKSVKTVNGVVYNLPTPEKADAEFLGWWMSDYQDATKLSRKYEEQKIEQDTKLFAVWKSNNVLAVSVNSNKITINSGASVGSIFTIKITNPANETDTKTQGNVTYDYDFSAKAAGDYVIEVQDNKGGKATVYFKNKALAQVSFFKVEDGNLIFNPVNNATKYLITVNCGDSTHVHTDYDNGTSTTYNFSKCKMQKGGIKFTVKAIADGYTESVSAEFAFSLDLDAVGEITIDDANGKASWAAVENAESYTVELFAGTELLKTDSVTTAEYSLKDYTGELTIKVTPVKSGYNSPDAKTKTFTKVSLAAPKNVRLVGSKIVWDADTQAASYIVNIDGTDYPVTTNEFALTEAIYGTRENSTISVKSVGAAAQNNSLYSDAIAVNYYTLSDNVTYQNGKVVWEPVLSASKYGIVFNGGAEQIINDGDASSFDITFTKSGANTITVRAYGQGSGVSEKTITVTSYKVKFDVSGGSSVTTVYKAKGDTVALPVSEKTGYNLSGWYDTPNGEDGSQYETPITVGEADMTVYAHWSSKMYKVTLVAGEEGALTDTVVEVPYGQDFNIAAATAVNKDSMIFFGGWYTERNGIGTKYTDEFGDGVFKWKDANDNVTLYADWWHVLSYEEIWDSGQLTGYGVVAGPDIKRKEAIKIPVTHNDKPVVQILAKAFSGCSLLTEVSIPDTIQLIEIGADGNKGAGSAFQNCTALKNVYIYKTEGNHDRRYSDVDGVLIDHNINNPSNGVQLEFYPSGRTEAYTIPDIVDTIPTRVFKDSNIEELYIPCTVNTIEQEAISSCLKLTKLVFLEPEGSQTAEALTIKAKAFYSCPNLTTVTLPSYLVDLDLTAFTSCRSLMEINVTKGDYYSSKGGFICSADGSTLLYASRYIDSAITIPEGVTAIADGAFEGCKYLKQVTIPGYVATIGARAFNNCPLLEKVTIDDEGSGLTINSSAFTGTNLTEIRLPSRLVSLKVNAFSGNTKLTKVDLYAENAKLERGAFASLTSVYYVTDLYIGEKVDFFDIAGVFGGAKLKNVKVAEGNESFGSYVINKETGETDNVLYDADITKIIYFPSTKTGDYTIPDSVTEIGDEVFANKSITEIKIGANVTTIGKNAFANCHNLEKIIFDDGTAELTIGEGAFRNCTNSKFTVLTLPARTRTIGAYAFENCVNLAGTMIIPEGVKTIGASAFKNCRSITGLSLPSTLSSIAETTKNIHSWSLASTSTPHMNVDYNIIGIFEGATNLATLTVASGNTAYASIDGILYKKDAQGNAAELMYSPMKNAGEDGVVTVPATVTKVWAEAFRNNDLLTSIVFTDTANEVTFAPTVFYDNDELVSVTLPVGLKTIEPQMFYGCAKLQSITIPNTVSLIRLRAFKDCASLATLTFTPGNTDNELVFESAGTGGMWYGYSYADDAIFNNCTSLKNVTIPERTTEIGVAAFYGCTGLETLSLPASLKTIGQDTFNYCENLTTITFADNSQLTSIGANAFGNTAKLTTVDFGENNALTTLGNMAFLGAEALTSITLPAGLTSIGKNTFQYCESLTSIVIPDTVTSIGDYAFSNCAKLATVSLSGTSLTSIGKYTFEKCKALTSISIPTSVTTIGQNAFDHCSKLGTVSFASGTSALTTVNKNAFQFTGLTSFTFPETSSTLSLKANLFNGCTKLASVHISSKIESVKQVFEGCPSITSVTVADNNGNLKAENGVIYNKYDNKASDAIQYVCTKMDLTATNGTYTIPSGVTTLGQSVFQGHSEIKKLIIPASVTTIGTYAFADCTGLEEVVFAYNFSVTSLPNLMFQHCSALKKISVQNQDGTLTENKLPDKITKVGTQTFLGCKSLTQLTLSSNFKTLSTSSFAYTGLTSITLPKVTSITSKAFQGCEDLTEVVLQANVTTFGQNAFEDCVSLTSITIPSSTTTIDKFAFRNTGLVSVTVPDSVTTINEGAFANCKNLQMVEIGAGVTTLGPNVFENCISLGKDTVKNGEVTLKGGITFKTVSITYIQKATFKNCTSLTTITLPSGVQHIGNGKTANDGECSAFEGCTALTSVFLPDTLTAIGNSAFKGCVSLDTILLSSEIAGKSAEEIAKLYGTANLSKITNLYTNAFMGAGLKSVTLTSLVDYYQGSQACYNGTFADCTKLHTVVVNDNLAQFMPYTFDGCSSLKNINIPSKLTSLGTYTFRDCVSLTAVTLPAKVSTIGDYVFAGCTKLADVKLGTTLTSIGASAFENCEALTSFTFDSTLTKIGEKAFKNTGVSNVTLPKALTTVGAQAFVDCENIQYFSVANGNAKFYVDENGIVYSNDNKIVLIPASYAPENGELVIPEGYGIADGALAGLQNITTLVLPSTLTEITTGMFRGLRNVSKIVLAEGVTSIGSYAFADCISLKQVNFPSTVTSIGSYAFAGTIRLTALTLPANLTSIGASAFANSGITSLEIPSGVTSITEVFKDAKALQSVTLPANLTAIGDSAFENSGITTLVIPNTVTSIGELAFAGSALTEIVIPDSVTTMANRVFMNATSLVSATMSKNAVSMFTDDPNDAVNGQMSLTEGRTFLGCTSLTTVVIPEGVQGIGRYSFEGCTSLTSVTLPSTLTLLDYGVFRKSGLKTINLPASLEIYEYNSSSKEEYASIFEDCTALETVTIADGIAYLPESLFAGCTSIKSIVIPAGVILKENVFGGWTKEQTINMVGSQFEAAGLSGSEANDKKASWDNGCDANIVWDYKAPTTEA